MSKKTKRLALTGRLPLISKYLNEKVVVNVRRQLERDGWRLDWESFEQRCQFLYQKEIVQVPKESAVSIPLLPGLYYGKMVKTIHVAYFLDDDKTESRGWAFHITDDSIRLLTNNSFYAEEITPVWSI